MTLDDIQKQKPIRNFSFYVSNFRAETLTPRSLSLLHFAYKVQQQQQTTVVLFVLFSRKQIRAGRVRNTLFANGTLANRDIN